MSTDTRQRLLFLVSTILILAIGAIDAATGVDLSVQILYLGPCWMVAWKVGRRSALALSALSAAVWLASDFYDGHTYSHPMFAASNTLTLFVFLVASSLVLNAMAEALARETNNARIDHLSGLWNARAFYELAEREVALATRDTSDVAVAYLDLDNFKHVNDTLGHLKADELLRTVASALRTSLRTTDVVGRLGGDEFAVVLPRTSNTQAELVLQRSLDSVIEATKRAGFSVTFSLGCVTARGQTLKFDDLLRAADQGMYDAKAAGRSGLVLTELPSS